MSVNSSPLDRRRRTRNSIYRHLYFTKSFCSRQDLARELELSLPTVYQNLSDLMAMGLVQDSGEQQSTRGRKASGLNIVPAARIAVGVSIVERNIRLVATDLRLNELAYQKVAIEPLTCFSDLGGRLAWVLEQFLDTNSLERERLLGIGIALPAIMNLDSRIITAAPTLSLTDTSLEGLTRSIPYPTYVENDATCGGFAEYFARRSRQTMAYLSLENGIGGAILFGGTPYPGETRRSGEFGHMCIVPGGLRCNCGKHGCLEAYCSPRRVQAELGLSLQDFFAGVVSNQPKCVLLWDNMLHHLAIGINNIHLALDCDVVLGGFLSGYIPPYFPRLKEYVAAGNPLEPSAGFLHMGTLLRHTVPLGAALHFVTKFLEQV